MKNGPGNGWNSLQMRKLNPCNYMDSTLSNNERPAGFCYITSWVWRIIIVYTGQKFLRIHFPVNMILHMCDTDAKFLIVTKPVTICMQAYVLLSKSILPILKCMFWLYIYSCCSRWQLLISSYNSSTDTVITREQEGVVRYTLLLSSEQSL